MKIAFNSKHIGYLLSLYDMTEDELLYAINDARKRKRVITWEDISGEEIDINHLKKIDKVFNRGLSYYSNPNVPSKSRDTSVFFRKEKFSAKLNLGARKRVREFEDAKIRISAICKLSNYKMDRRLDVYNVDNNPKQVAFYLRERILPKYTSDITLFLKKFINSLGANNVLVFEFVETHNKKEKANIDGFYIKPNVIVLKRNQDFKRREIFTLAHEFGHYLLQCEEVDELDFERISEARENLSEVERWCNTFAYNLLLGKSNADKLDAVQFFDSERDYGYQLVEDISKATHLSKIAIFTNLLFQNKISYSDYIKIKNDLRQQWEAIKNAENAKKELEKAAGIPSKGRSPKPIRSDLVTDVYNHALDRGVVSEYDYCKELNVNPKDFDRLYYACSY